MMEGGVGGVERTGEGGGRGARDPLDLAAPPVEEGDQGDL